MPGRRSVGIPPARRPCGSRWRWGLVHGAPASPPARQVAAGAVDTGRAARDRAKPCCGRPDHVRGGRGGEAGRRWSPPHPAGGGPDPAGGAAAVGRHAPAPGPTGASGPCVAEGQPPHSAERGAGGRAAGAAADPRAARGAAGTSAPPAPGARAPAGGALWAGVLRLAGVTHRAAGRRLSRAHADPAPEGASQPCTGEHDGWPGL
jgi:hypothetical protein